jgi:SH3 domain-containing protein
MRGGEVILQVPSHAPMPPHHAGRPVARAAPDPVTTTYVECPQCGKRALSVATRCPHCGFNFPPRPLHRPAETPSLGRLGVTLTVGGALVAIILAAVLVHRGPSKTDAARAAAPPPPPDTSTAPAPVAVTDTASPSPAATPASRTPAQPGVRRYAHTWVNVRGDRARSAPAVGMLNPGDAVVVDSLIRGWYRVVVDGRVLGYVHRSTLDITRPE